MKIIFLNNYIKSIVYTAFILFAVAFSVSAQRIDNTNLLTNGWSLPLNISNTPFNSTSPASTVNKERKIYVVWQEWDQPQNDLLARIYYTTCTVSQWSDPIPITTELGKADWTPDIAVDTSGNPHIVWGEWLSGDVFYKYYDGSLWSNNVNVSETQGGAFYPCIAIGNDNTVHIAWHANYKVYYRQLRENQWSGKIVLSDTTMSCSFVKLCTDSNNSVHFTWGSYGPNEDDWRIWYRKLEAGMFDEPELVFYDSTHHQSSHPDIAAFNNNLPAIVWEQITQWDTIPITEKNFYSEFNGIEWSAPETVSDSSRSSRPDISIDKNTIPYLVWDHTQIIPREDHTQVLFTYKSNNNWITPENLSYQLPKNSGSAKIVIDPNNNLYVIWYYGAPYPDPGEILYSYHEKITFVNDDKNLLMQSDFVLYQNYPNPFNPVTKIRYQIPNDGLVTLKVYDILGSEVATLVNEPKEAGRYAVVFQSAAGHKQLASGIYLYRIQAGDYVNSKKMILIK